MERRQFLAGLTAAAGAGLAGCARSSLLTDVVALRRSKTVRGADETNLPYAADGSEVCSVALDYAYREAAGQVRLRASIWHREGTTLDDLHLALRAPASGVRPVTDVYLKTPFPGRGPTVDFETERDGRTTVVGVPEMGSTAREPTRWSSFSTPPRCPIRSPSPTARRTG